MRPNSLLLITALGLSACAPRALFFHETTKVAFAADYNVSDSQPLATSFGYKRRIVAVVPSQEREIPNGGSERHGTNSGEALSLISKFNVRAGTSEGIVITNNFASGMAARLMTRSVGSPEALNILMHSAPIEVSATTGATDEGRPATEIVNARLKRFDEMRLKRTPQVTSPIRRKIVVGEDGTTRIGGPRPPAATPAPGATPAPATPSPHRRRINVDADGRGEVERGLPALPLR